MGEYFARVFITEIEEFMPLQGKKILDVGGATGVFCRILAQERDCEAVNLDPYPDKCNPGEPVWPKTTVAFADDIPFNDKEFDLVVCRGVLEHVPTEKQQKSVDEMCRVAKFGGFCYILIPPWYNPHAGHELKPFHVLPFKLAKFLRQVAFKKGSKLAPCPSSGCTP